MKRIILLSIGLLVLLLPLRAETWIRINQAGYRPGDVKVAVLISEEETTGFFRVRDALTGGLVTACEGRPADPSKWGLRSAWRLDFTALDTPGSYYIEAGGVESPVFRIGTDVYDGLADFLLTYMRQQRCGDNPYNGHPCHLDDGYIVYHPTRTGEHIDVTGGWHDATDYLQYMTTTSTSSTNSLPGTSTGRRRPLASGSPSSILIHLMPVTKPFFSSRGLSGLL